MKAFEIGTLPSGKRNLKIVPYEVHHLEMDEKGKIRAVAVPEISPYRVKSFLNWFEIPCGYCDGCRIDRSREWANRCKIMFQCLTMLIRRLVRLKSLFHFVSVIGSSS